MNSILLLFDHLRSEDISQFEDQLGEVGRYYRFVKVSELVGRLRKRKTLGQAAIVFKSARKSIFVHAVSRLLEREIPFSLMLRPDCIGLNRLSVEDEIEIYRKFYPGDIPDLEGKGEVEIRASLRKIGKLPIEKLDPLMFFGTWGELTRIPPTFVELGLALSSRAAEQELTFIRQQTGVAVRIAYGKGLSSEAKATLERLGIEAYLTDRSGVIDKDTDPMDLPHWALTNESSKE